MYLAVWHGQIPTLQLAECRFLQGREESYFRLSSNPINAGRMIMVVKKQAPTPKISAYDRLA